MLIEKNKMVCVNNNFFKDWGIHYSKCNMNWEKTVLTLINVLFY